MSSTMKMMGWSAVGLRCPDHTVDCCDAEGKPMKVVLVQMPNGTGKTTTLNLMRAALSGEGRTWDAERVRSFQKRSAKSATGTFQVKLRLNGKLATFQMDFDFDKAVVGYKTTYGSGRVNDFKPPPDFRRFLGENFINFYIFDGEFADRILDKEHTDAEAIVDRLFQINILKSIRDRVSDYWDERAEDDSASEERGLSRRKNRLTTLRERKRLLEDERAVLLTRKEALNKSMADVQSQYNIRIKKNEQLSKDLAAADSVEQEMRAGVREAAQVVLDNMRDPQALSPSLADALGALKGGLDKAKLPESAAREFFEDLALEPECVCGREITTEISDTIKTRARRYLGSEDNSFLNMMKTSIVDALADGRDAPHQSLSDSLSILETYISKHRSSQNDLDALKLDAEGADPAAKAAADKIRDLEEALRQVNADLEKYESDDDSLGDERTMGIKIIDRRIHDAEHKLDRINKTLKLKQKRDALIKILEKAHTDARASVAKELCQEANNKIEALMPNNNIRIDHINKCLHLKGQSGGSAGENLSVAYAFISTLFDRSDHELPFIVDSPAGAIDLGIRPRIGELIPKLTNQFVAFTISSERDQFVGSLKRESKGDLKLLTLFRKGPDSIEAAARKCEKFDETPDGILVNDHKFFENFQLEKQD